MDINIISVGSKVIEKGDFFVSRLTGHPRYVFIQFISEVSLLVDGKEEILPPGSCIIYSPSYPESYKSTTIWLNHDWIEFNCKDEAIFKELQLRLNAPFLTNISQNITNQIAQIKAISNSNSLQKNVELTAKFYELLIAVSKNLHSKFKGMNEQFQQGLRETFEQIRLNIYQHPNKTSVAKISKEAGYTESYFCANYKNLFHTSPLTDLNKARVIYVKNALENNVKTSVLIEELGFSSLEYFYMWFKKQFNKTVGEYLKEKSSVS